MKNTISKIKRWMGPKVNGNNEKSVNLKLYQ